MKVRRWPPALLALALIALLLAGALTAPLHLPAPDASLANAGPGAMPPFGADHRGRPLLDYARQGAWVVALPSLFAGALVMGLATAGGLLATLGGGGARSAVQALAEVVGSLPRMVVILVVALVLPRDDRSLYPMAVTWALLAAPGAMDEAAAVAQRLGGARFVEALRAHGFSAARIFGWHLVGLNLRPVVVRQGAEVMMQVVFLEMALSYLATVEDQPSFTHPDSMMSWADLLYMGYRAVVLQTPTGHALALGLALVAAVAGVSLAIGAAARAR